ncbi:MAG: response regulator transcription factor [Firmicutes bacterium]|nr:response regulator transcription factor [Bacillota bacterium]
MKHIFVVDDEKNIRDLIHKYLEKEGYMVTRFADGHNLVSAIARTSPDLVVLDINLPLLDGLELCKAIRKSSDTPIIFVSARDEELDRVLGLELGGDDYLTKPFSPRELVVRIKNIFKRIEKADRPPEEIVCRDLRLDPVRRYIEKDGMEVKLTGKEYELLFFLLQNKNRSFTREQLIERIWGFDYLGETRIADDLVKRIRRKLQSRSSQVEITTVWGYGYRLDD